MNSQRNSRVYKYNLLWQLIRVQNKKEKCLQNKLINIKNFLTKYSSIENKERVLNYLNGLALGYKDPFSKTIIYDFKNKLNKIKIDKKDTDVSISSIETDKLILLYNDLYKRNENWLKNNYKNKDLNEFLKKLYKELETRKIIVSMNFNTNIKGKSRQKFLY